MQSKALLEEVISKYQAIYEKRTSKSKELFNKAKKVFPGGDGRASVFFLPYPFWISKASGCSMTDVDGNEYIDFNNNNTALVLGHAHPEVVNALQEQILKGTCHGALMPVAIHLAELICGRVKSVDKIRFTNTGTEAGMVAVRLARAFTGRDKILKPVGGYSGTYDAVATDDFSQGIPTHVRADTITVTYNDIEAAADAIKTHGSEIAAMILEPMMGSGGMIPAKIEYLKALRELTSANDIILIFDEVLTLRLHQGGLQEVHGVKPDLTMFGKVIGGGIPIGGVGGKEEIMALTNTQGKDADRKTVPISGTFNANPISTSAGVATLEYLSQREINRINGLGESLAQGIRKVLSKLGIKGQVTGKGSLQYIHFYPTPVENFETRKKGNQDIKYLLHLALMERGVYVLPRCLFAISTPMTEKEIDICINAVDDALNDMKPNIERFWPELIST